LSARWRSFSSAAEGDHAGVIKERSTALEARRIDLDRLLTDAEEPPPLLHPEMATYYRERYYRER
jgi:site-specific DNA recombinase